MMKLLKVSNLQTNYGNIEALKGIDLHVEEGKIVTILGANGAGKTTTMKTIIGLLKPKKGKIEFLKDRKSTRLNSSHVAISYAVFCLKKKKRIVGNKYYITDQ